MVISHANAQLDPQDNSPYSRYGIGDITDPSFASTINMGGLGATYHSNTGVNVLNPASYAYLTNTSFEAGLYGEYSRLIDSENINKSWNGNIGYISLSMPFANPINDLLDRVDRKVKVGMNISIAPYSTVGYNIESVLTEENIGEYIRNYAGAGGTYRSQLGFGANYKNISGGINLGYLFGKISTERIVSLTSASNPYNNFFESDYHVSGFLWNAGVMYDYVLNKTEIEEDASVSKRVVTLGLYGNSATSYKTTQNELLYAQQIVSGDLDTISSAFNVEGNGKLPSTIGFGVSLKNGEKSLIGINYEATAWSNFQNDADPRTLTNGYKLSAGGFFSPDPKSYLNYFKRIKYQYGVFYSSDPRSILSEEVTNYGISLGFGLPFINQRKISSTNFGVILGIKGSGTVIEERYMRINFGFTFNDDDWFIKRKYN